MNAATVGAWQDSALCAQVDPELFFPVNGGSHPTPKKICRRCEVKDECLEWALDHDEEDGIYGGLTAKERQRLKRRKT